MKVLKKISSLFIALSIMLSVVGFASAALVSKENLKTFLMQFPIGHPNDYDSSNMPTLKQYPKTLNFLSELLLDLKVEEQDLDVHDQNSLATKLYQHRVKKDVLELNSRYSNMLIFMAYASVLDNYKFVSNYMYKEDKSLYGPMHFCYMTRIIDNSGNEQLKFYWIDKEECKKTVKQMMDGTFDIKENYFWKDKFKNDDHDLLFLKHTQDAMIKYFGDIDSLFNDEEFSTKFFKTMFEIITDNGKSPGDDKRMISIVSSNRSEEISDYKKLGHDIIKKSLEYKGHQEGKDYEIEYDDTTGYIKSIKKLSNKDLKNGNIEVAVSLMNSVVIMACIFLAIIIVAAIVIIVVVLAKRK